jgi:hypothetical protein
MAVLVMFAERVHNRGPFGAKTTILLSPSQLTRTLRS